jgi:lipopolysaccharide transport system permease protein
MHGLANVIQPRTSLLRVDVRALWQYRELLFFLVWRDIKVRYKQTAIGAGWAILQPLLTMLILTVIFGRFANIPSDEFPYPIFAYSALLPWFFFAQGLSRSSASLVGNAQLIGKVYFPRMLIPLAAVIAPLADFGISFLFFLLLMGWFGIAPTWGILALPMFLLLAIMTALAAGLWFAALDVQYRDVGHALPFVIQVWMFVSPIAYPVSLVPERFRILYGLNPLAGVIEGFRWALLGKASPDFSVMAVSAGVVVVALIGGVLYFNHMERTFADVI